MLAKFTRAMARILLFAFLVAPEAWAQTDDGFSVIRDDKTSITIGLPLGLLPNVEITKLGRQWSSADGAIKVDLFVLTPKQLGEVFGNVKGIAGRVATRAELKSNSFVLEGYDADGSHFRIEAVQNAEAVKGFSVVYPKSRAEALKPMLKKIAESFEPSEAAKHEEQPAAYATAFADVAKSGTPLQVHGIGQGDKLNIREFANAKSAVLGELPDQATELVATGRTSENSGDMWVEIKHGGKRGWVNSRFVRKVETQQLAETKLDDASRPFIPKSEEKSIVSTDPVSDCNSDDRDRKLRGCEVLIRNSALPPQVRALALSRRADSYLAVGDFERSIADLTQADKLQTDDLTRKRLSFAYYLRGLSHSRANKHDEAIVNFGQAISIDAKNDQAFIARANAYADHGKLDDAIADLARWLESGKNSSDVQSLLADLYKRRALMRLAEKQYASATIEYSAAINLMPDRTELYLMRATAYLAYNQELLAMTDASTVIGKEPNNISARLLRAQARGATNDHAGAVEDYSVILEAQPKNTGVILSRALAYERLEQFSDAQADYKRLLRLEPKNDTARRNLKRSDAFVKWRNSRK